MDTAYGNGSRLRAGMTALGVLYVALPNTLIWRPVPATAPGQAAEQFRPTRRARSGLGQGNDACSTEAGLAHGDVAERLSRLAVLALCTCARPCRVHQAGPREAVAGVAVDRMA